MELPRCSGILCHITSLPGKYGIGDLGKEAYQFVDFLIESNQQIWQILPLGPIGYGNSPYNCYSALAGNHLLISLEKLKIRKLLTEQDLQTDKTFNEDRVDFNDVIHYKHEILKRAYLNFMSSDIIVDKMKFQNFCKKNAYWLHDYALFMALKDHFNGAPWYEWENNLVQRKPETLEHYRQELKSTINYHKVLQYFFFQQWSELKDYANRNFIHIFGDIPIYVARDSVDVWVNSDVFQLDAEKMPVFVAGVPPDYFSEDGQLWGNPVYNWDKLEETGFAWWIQRITANLKLFDIIRIDHFRGFAKYWAVPFGEKTARNGKWMDAKGHELFSTLKKTLGDIPVVAEDLGVITPDVIALRDEFNLPGMKILQFAFDSEEGNDYSPHNYIKNCLVYTGTHDNNTTLGWYRDQLSDADKQKMREYTDLEEYPVTDKQIVWKLIRLAWSSVADYAVVPLQDIFQLDQEARMNLPGTTDKNWDWRIRPEYLLGKKRQQTAEKLRKITKLYGRSA